MGPKRDQKIFRGIVRACRTRKKSQQVDNLDACQDIPVTDELLNDHDGEPVTSSSSTLAMMISSDSQSSSLTNLDSRLQSQPVLVLEDCMLLNSASSVSRNEMETCADEAVFMKQRRSKKSGNNSKVLKSTNDLIETSSGDDVESILADSDAVGDDVGAEWMMTSDSGLDGRVVLKCRRKSTKPRTADWDVEPVLSKYTKISSDLGLLSSDGLLSCHISNSVDGATPEHEVAFISEVNLNNITDNVNPNSSECVESASLVTSLGFVDTELILTLPCAVSDNRVLQEKEVKLSHGGGKRKTRSKSDSVEDGDEAVPTKRVGTRIKRGNKLLDVYNTLNTGRTTRMSKQLRSSSPSVSASSEESLTVSDGTLADCGTKLNSSIPETSSVEVKGNSASNFMDKRVVGERVSNCDDSSTADVLPSSAVSYLPSSHFTVQLNEHIGADNSLYADASIGSATVVAGTSAIEMTVDYSKILLTDFVAHPIISSTESSECTTTASLTGFEAEKGTSVLDTDAISSIGVSTESEDSLRFSDEMPAPELTEKSIKLNCSSDTNIVITTGVSLKSAHNSHPSAIFCASDTIELGEKVLENVQMKIENSKEALLCDMNKSNLNICSNLCVSSVRDCSIADNDNGTTSNHTVIDQDLCSEQLCSVQQDDKLITEDILEEQLVTRSANVNVSESCLTSSGSSGEGVDKMNIPANTDCCGTPPSNGNTPDRKIGSGEIPLKKRWCKDAKSRSGGVSISDMFIGCHISSAGNLSNVVHVAKQLGAQSFGMFLRSQRDWRCDPLNLNEANAFKQALTDCGYVPRMIVPHASFLLNCGSSDPLILRQSRDLLVDDLRRCLCLSLVLFNFHPGSFSSGTIDECIGRIADSINYAHDRVAGVVTVIENTCGAVGMVGGRLLELKKIIDRVKNKRRIGICLDTCHAFAAGYDIRTEDGYDSFMQELNDVIGWDYVKAIHINDSLNDLGSCVDHHARIGSGKIGSACFRLLVNDRRLRNIPMILETPANNNGESHDSQIKSLYSLID